VACFVEKPDLKTAEAYCASGQYYWNSGMFLFRLSTLLKAFETYAPEILTAAENAIALSQKENCFVRPNREAFQQSPENSMDYALLEKLPKTTVIPLQAQWCDVGSWPSVAEQHTSDGLGNTQVGDVVLQDTTRTFVQATHRLVTTIGVDNLIVIETQDAVLILNKEQAGQLKTLIHTLKTHHAAVLNTHSRVVRPWGAFESVTAGPRFQVKRITVNVGSKLSLQKHHHRSEHWVVVRGSAKVTRDQEEFLVTENESTYIPIGAIHRLENVGKIPLEIIEVQSGSYLGEDDIVRLEDVYGRIEA
jgi:mannose-1-phosphate guanylyltransferase/mannose-6-phosphate isomerase